MDNLISTILPQSKTISSMAMNEPTTPNVPSGNFLNRKNNHGIAPNPYHDVSLEYCTTLPPSPKDHIDNDPACVDGKKYPFQPFKSDSCYMLYSPQQNMWGPVCGSGGSNADWVRGNRFGVSYQPSNLAAKRYAIDTPKFLKKNPVVVNNSPFYPYPDYRLRKSDDYKTYPYENSYTNDGLPTYVYPYTTLNKSPVIIEGFGNELGSLMLPGTLIVLLLIGMAVYGRR